MARYWFKPKTYGYGATPSTWEGWACLGAFLVLMLASQILTPLFVADPDLAALVRWSISALLIGGLIGVAYLKCEDGWGWRWGPRRDE